MKKILLLTGLMTMLNVALLGQTTVQHGMLHHNGALKSYTAPQEVPDGMAEIYSSLGTNPKNLYNWIDTWLVSGPKSAAVVANFIAMPFTPQSDAHILQARVAILWDEVGADQVNLSINEDSNGHPGKLLAGPVTVKDLPHYFACCQLAVANFSSAIAVKAGSRYWVVADTPASGEGSDFVGEWAGAVSPVLPLASNASGTGWVTFNGNGFPAGDVQGTIP
jgi:hypothetical protein